MQRDFFNHDASVADDAKAAFKEVSERAAAQEATETKTHVESTEANGSDNSKPDSTPRTDGRTPDGRFARKDGSVKSDPPGSAGAPKDAGSEGDTKAAAEDEKSDDAGKTPAAAATTPTAPPTSWSVKAKAAWESLPEHVRADILKRETEMGGGLAALQEYKDLKPYAELAKQNGTTVPQFLDRAIGIERLLRQDLASGLATITKNFGLDAQRAGQLFLRMAQQLGATGAAASPPIGQPQNGQQPDPLMDALRPALDPLQREVMELRNMLQQRQVADRNAAQQSLATAYEAFKGNPANRYFNDVEETMATLMELKRVPVTGNHPADLKAAYDMAVKLHPEIQQALIEQRLADEKAAERKREQEAADKAKAASRSVTGSRIPGSTVTESHERLKNHEEDIRADVMRAMRMSARA